MAEKRMGNQDKLALLEIMEDPTANGSIIITSLLPVSQRYNIIGEKTIADAILYRLVHCSHRIEFSGESMRKKKSINLSNKNSSKNRSFFT